MARSEADTAARGARGAIQPTDPEAARVWLGDLRDAAAGEGLDDLVRWIGAGGTGPDEIAAILEHSPFLRAEALNRTGCLTGLLSDDLGQFIAERVTVLARLPEEEMTESSLSVRLRLEKREIALLLALGDLTGRLETPQTVRLLSDLADAAIAAALRFCLGDLARNGKLKIAEGKDPVTSSGLFVLAMGKLGARELNFSSDVDLILFFDPDVGALEDRAQATDIFSRLARRLVRLLNDRTAEGYVFRTDLRLRPDPGATPLAISTGAALGYYESSGRNWERAAMIRARPIAGDLSAAERFLEELSPFVWRRYLDFRAIADIRSMKTRIDEHRGFDAIGIAGHNVKLGRGGIREVEFFIQAHQLIAGGRAPSLRRRSTEEALDALVEGGWVDPAARSELSGDYWFLRRVEHVLQMIADEQTHTMPETDEAILPVARLAGFADRDAFDEALLSTLKRVDRHYIELFNEGRRRGGEAGEDSALAALVDKPDDDDALQKLSAFGFSRPTDVAKMVHDWSSGRYRSTRSQAVQEELKRAVPLILPAFAKASDPDTAFAAFDRFLAGLPAGIQFFSIITANPKILDLLVLVIAAAPGLRDTLAARPHVFDALIDPDFLGTLPDRDHLAERLDAFLADARHFEDVLSRLRIFASEQRFLIGARLLAGVAEAQEAGLAFSDLADLVVARTLTAVTGEFTRRHGQIPGQRVALIGMGRLGSRELTASSDLDLILVFEHEPGAEESNGEKPLVPSVYFPRLTQRLISGLTAATAEGVLYDVDFRLRPSGNSGPLATSLKAFERYQTNDAWTWEHMALTRSRFVAGDQDLGREIEKTVRRILSKKRERSELAEDVAHMRGRIERDKPGKNPLDLKLRPGGTVDLEFLAQWAMLDGRVPLDLIGQPTDRLLEAAFPAEGGARDGLDLASAMRSITAALQLLRIGPHGAAHVSDLPEGLALRLAEELSAENPEAVEARLAELCAAVRSRFETLLPMSQEDVAE